MRKIAIATILTSFTFAGCSSLENIRDTSFYDDNESVAAIDLLVDVKNIECSSDNVKEQVSEVRGSLNWYMAYSEVKKSRDVSKMLKLMDTTVKGMEDRDKISKGFCTLKRKIMIEQSSNIARATMGRF